MTRCDWASCTKPGEIAAGQWLFCAKHAAMDETHKVGAPARKSREGRPYVAQRAKAVIPCGTYAAYQRHRRDDTEVCDDCRAAVRLRSQLARERRAAA